MTNMASAFFEHISVRVLSILFLIVGFIWLWREPNNLEPYTLIIPSTFALLRYIFFKNNNILESEIKDEAKNTNTNLSLNPVSQKNSLNINDNQAIEPNRNDIIEIMKKRLNILFIDDDTKFQIVSIIKDSGWTKTKSIVDIKNISLKDVKQADVYFVDINGVGKLLNLKDEGLDLALMLKESYPEKKVIIYSASKKSNSFHKAWEIADHKLEKNALPNQFTGVIEKFAIEKYSK
jgi:hypothetical protein